jgi:hypothetical protein
MDAGLPHGQEARAPINGSLRIIVEIEKGHRGERLRDGADPLGDLAPEQSRESLCLLTRKANREPGLLPWELLRAIETESEGEAEAPRLAVGEASGP